MTCPYCGEQVNHGVPVCKTCHRDITLVVSLQEANHALEERVAELEAELAPFRSSATPQAEEPAEPPRPLGILDIAAVYFALPTVLLIAVHYLLVIKFDTSLIWLRAASIVLPAIFGLVLDRRAQPRWFLTLALGFVVALVSVLGMSTMVHFTDGDPILPKGGVAWRETFEYVASISLAYLLGGLIARALRPLGAHSARATGRIAQLATFFARRMSGGKKARTLEERVQRMIKLIQLAISISTALGAIYTGFKSIL